jgi:hypothetical protein
MATSSSHGLLSVDNIIAGENTGKNQTNVCAKLNQATKKISFYGDLRSFIRYRISSLTTISGI